MYSVENNVTSKNIELARNTQELVNLYEKEAKLLVTSPDAFEVFRAVATPIEQVYLSNPTDEFSLRVRKEQSPDGPVYSAQLKDRGFYENGAKVRIEVSTKEISEETYGFYASHPDFTPFSQQRAQITDEVSIDFIDGHAPIIEVETNDEVRRAEILRDLEGLVEDKTNGTSLDKERIAHELAGKEVLKSPESLDAFTDRVIREMIAHYSTGKKQVVVGLTGMSGSGKTTVTKAIQSKMVEMFGETFEPFVISTDDYHFGKTALDAINGKPWTEWDDPRTYNTAELARDLALVAEGQSLIRRHFDFSTEEPVFDEEVNPSPFILIEGLYAGSKDLEPVRDLHFRLPSTIATSVGRDVRRLVIENRANRVFPTPASRLSYQLETAIPLYLSQEMPGRNSFNASMRTMPERADMLRRLAMLSS